VLPETVVDALLAHVGAEWHELPERERPAGVWLREHAALPTEATVLAPATPLRRVWFLDERGLRPADPWICARFHAVHVVQLWCQRPHGEPSAVFAGVHLVGLAAFAPYAAGDEVYLERLWGGRRGVGERVAVDAAGRVRVRQQLWAS